MNYRGSDPAANADREEYRRAKLVCIKESWIRCGFIMALALPSAILLWSDSSRLLSGRAVLPFLTQFVRIIVIFCMSNGYTSELYDLTRRQRFGTLLISISFVIGKDTSLHLSILQLTSIHLSIMQFTCCTSLHTTHTLVSYTLISSPRTPYH